ncbi:hypothetical protein DXG01_003164 [Tephrocybe rancida]|nr:hypothetical protein DXG01_003164 [Tephrocybe rancida]
MVDLPFQEMGWDITTIPPLAPATYPFHFQLPPLGPGAFVAPNDSEVNPLNSSTKGNAAECQCAARQAVHAPSPVPYSGNKDDPAYGMELSDSEVIPSPITNPAGCAMDCQRTMVPSRHYPGNDSWEPAMTLLHDMDPALGMELSDNEWDPSVGLVLSDDEDVAANMEISDDE